MVDVSFLRLPSLLFVNTAIFVQKEFLFGPVFRKHYLPCHKIFFIPSPVLSAVECSRLFTAISSRTVPKSSPLCLIFHVEANTVGSLLRSTPWPNRSVPYSIHKIGSPSLIVFPFTFLPSLLSLFLRSVVALRYPFCSCRIRTDNVRTFLYFERPPAFFFFFFSRTRHISGPNVEPDALFSSGIASLVIELGVSPTKCTYWLGYGSAVQ